MSERGAIYWAGFALLARGHLSIESGPAALLVALLAAKGRAVDDRHVSSLWFREGGNLKRGSVRIFACHLREALRDLGLGEPVQTRAADAEEDRSTAYSITPADGARIIAWLEARV